MAKQSRTSKYILIGVLLTGIIFLAFWIRIQGVSQLPFGQFTEHDAYLYNYQAGIITEQGILPARDMHRWLPLGRDNTQLLSLCLCDSVHSQSVPVVVSLLYSTLSPYGLFCDWTRCAISFSHPCLRHTLRIHRQCAFGNPTRQY